MDIRINPTALARALCPAVGTMIDLFEYHVLITQADYVWTLGTRPFLNVRDDIYLACLAASAKTKNEFPYIAAPMPVHFDLIRTPTSPSIPPAKITRLAAVREIGADYLKTITGDVLFTHEESSDNSGFEWSLFYIDVAPIAVGLAANSITPLSEEWMIQDEIEWETNASFRDRDELNWGKAKGYAPATEDAGILTRIKDLFLSHGHGATLTTTSTYATIDIFREICGKLAEPEDRFKCTFDRYGLWAKDLYFAAAVTALKDLVFWFDKNPLMYTVDVYSAEATVTLNAEGLLAFINTALENEPETTSLITTSEFISLSVDERKEEREESRVKNLNLVSSIDSTVNEIKLDCLALSAPDYSTMLESEIAKPENFFSFGYLVSSPSDIYGTIYVISVSTGPLTVNGINGGEGTIIKKKEVLDDLHCFGAEEELPGPQKKLFEQKESPSTDRTYDSMAAGMFFKDLTWAGFDHAETHDKYMRSFSTSNTVYQNIAQDVGATVKREIEADCESHFGEGYTTDGFEGIDLDPQLTINLDTLRNGTVLYDAYYFVPADGSAGRWVAPYDGNATQNPRWVGASAPEVSGGIEEPVRWEGFESLPTYTHKTIDYNVAIMGRIKKVNSYLTTP